ncbi:MAG: hypothetical protein HUJ94_06195 [Bacteroidales bacterium]|nr:hypothetical protein [Bacteroidales bacterium]
MVIGKFASLPASALSKVLSASALSKVLSVSALSKVLSASALSKVLSASTLSKVLSVSALSKVLPVSALSKVFSAAARPKVLSAAAISAAAVLACSCRGSASKSGWDRLLDSYSDNDGVRQMLLVKYTAGSNADAEFYIKDKKGMWQCLERGSAYVGKNGIGKTREGDGKTPVGIFGVRRAFGILDNPGVSMEYLHVTETTYACDEEGPYYNTIIDTREIPHTCKGEHMIDYAPQYNYGMETTFNDSNIYPEGSAIFLHCKGSNPYTEGCIALDQEFMKKILLNSDKNILIAVFPASLAE